ncbi:MAG TPA: carboxypeptidase-like regulatory domain-containing protein [Acidobacteriaceae bacterium]|nr:carboxypeptidase-like regulatory domain-containing protein [Acidobacteriaceae bacterium]
MRFTRALVACLLFLLVLLASGQQVTAPQPQSVSIIGTVTDVQNDVLPGATVTLTGPTPADTRTATTDDNGFFAFRDLPSGVAYHVSIRINGFVDYTSATLTPQPGQQTDLGDIKLTLSVVQTTVTAVSEEQIATQEVKLAEKQRVLGIVPNFYVTYDKHPVPLTSKLKFKLAFRTSIDPVNFAGVGFLAAVDQAGDTPNYQQGWLGYAQRYGAEYTDSFTDIMFGGAILPSLFHQDPRYFYQGTGTVKSRFLHAISTPFICPADNGHHEFNISSIGGDVISGAISNLYYPRSNRGAGLVFGGALIDTGARVVNALAQEFIFPRFTSHSKDQN